MACDDRTSFGCRVSFGEHAILGPDPIDAPFLSSDLAAALLDRTRDTPLVEPTMRFSYDVEFLVLVWELHLPVLQQLAARGAAVEFCVNTDADDPEAFDAQSTSVELRVFTMRDPDELTVELDAEPATIGRIGEMLSDGHPRRTNYWRAAREVDGVPELDALWIEFMRPFPTTTATLCDGVFGLSLSCASTSGSFRLAPTTIARMAALGQAFGCWIYAN